MPRVPPVAKGRAAARFRRDTAALTFAIGVVGVATVAVRLPGAIADPLNYDEVLSARTFTQAAPWSVAGDVARFDSNPVGWYLLAWVANGATAAAAALAGFDGETTWVPRLLSVAFSGALAALLVLYARRFLPLWSAALAAALVGLGYQFIEHGKELRPYALLSLAAVALAYALEETVALPTRRRAAVLALVVAVGSLTHYFFVLALAVAAAWVWVAPAAREARGRVVRAIGLGLVPFALSSPVLLYQLFGQRSETRGWIGPFSPDAVLDVYGDVFAAQPVWKVLDDLGQLFVLALVLAGALLLVRRPEGQLCALLAVVPVALAAILWALGQPVFNARNALVAAPFAAVAIGAAIAAVSWRPLALAAGAAVVAAAVSAYAVHARLGRTSGEAIADSLVELGWRPEQPVLWFGSPWPTSTVAWSLPGRPKLLLRTRGGGRCDEMYAIALTRRGARWIERRGRDVVRTRRVPFYGATPRGRRRAYDVVIARLSWSADASMAADAAGARHLAASGAEVACLHDAGPPP